MSKTVVETAFPVPWERLNAYNAQVGRTVGRTEGNLVCRADRSCRLVRVLSPLSTQVALICRYTEERERRESVFALGGHEERLVDDMIYH